MLSLIKLQTREKIFMTDNISFQNDFETACTLFVKAGEILHQHGFANAKYWSQSHIEEEFLLSDEVEKHGFYVMYVDGIAAGAVILETQTKDEGLWNDYKTANALYISKMCIVPPFRGKKYSRTLFDFCISQAQKLSCDSIRFDTCAESRAHCAYYKKCGFEEVGRYQDFDERLCLFEMKLS